MAQIADVHRRRNYLLGLFLRGFYVFFVVQCELHEATCSTEKRASWGGAFACFTIRRSFNGTAFHSSLRSWSQVRMMGLYQTWIGLALIFCLVSPSFQMDYEENAVDENTNEDVLGYYGPNNFLDKVSTCREVLWRTFFFKVQIVLFLTPFFRICLRRTKESSPTFCINVCLTLCTNVCLTSCTRKWCLKTWAARKSPDFWKDIHREHSE